MDEKQITYTSVCKACGSPNGIAVKYDNRIIHVCASCGKKIREGVLHFILETSEVIEVLS